MKNLILIKRIAYLRHEINNVLITDFGLSVEKAYSISLGTNYSPMIGDVKKVESMNLRFKQVNILEELVTTRN